MAKKQKVHSLTGRIDDRLMMQAFKAVKRNRGAAGIDKVSIAMFEENLDANLAALKRDLKTKGKFVPKPLRRVWIPKDAKGKKLRPLGIPVSEIVLRAVRGRLRRCVPESFAGRSSPDSGGTGHDRARTLAESREDEDRKLRERL